MHALKSCVRAALITGAATTALVSAVVAGPQAALATTTHAAPAHATAVTGHIAQAGGHGNAGGNPDSLAQIARTLPKVGPKDVLKLAAGQVGITENSDGGGTKFHDWYMSTPRAQETLARDGGTLDGYANAPWCDMFVSWVGEQLGITPVMGSDAYTVEHATWFAEHGRWGHTPKPGAVVFFDWSGGSDIDGIDHVGFVVRDNGDGTIETIEGNTGDGGAVEERTRSTGYVTGYGYPLYTAP
ncbi:CHAP domain-containing protein [Sphaerimonospora cavernae]|uniref:CHAP domain-containing protein n=1 Tax=Sphaerimonospora cavernae TaxID=1740611 RepID=A0ABV6UDF4_9ACTN